MHSARKLTDWKVSDGLTSISSIWHQLSAKNKLIFLNLGRLCLQEILGNVQIVLIVAALWRLLHQYLEVRDVYEHAVLGRWVSFISKIPSLKCQ